MTAISALTCDNGADRRGAGNASTVLTHLPDLGERGLGVSLPSNEEWRPVPGYEGVYEVSTHARVRNARGRILCPQIQPTGHRQFRLIRDRAGKRKCFGLHRLMLMAFVRLPVEGEEGRHLNGDPADNRIENLAWGSHADNMQDMIRHGRNPHLNKTHCSNGHAFAEEAVVRLRLRGDELRPARDCRRCQTEQIDCPNCGKSVQRGRIRDHQRSIRCRLGELPSKQQPIKHGTAAGRTLHSKRGIPVCEPCREANNRYEAERMARKRQEAS